MPAIRVCFVTTTYPLRPGDAIPGFVADLAQNLVRHENVAVRVVAPHHPGAARRETVNGVDIRRFTYTLDPAKQVLAYGNGIPDNVRNFRRAKWQVPGFFAAMFAAVWEHTADCDLIHAHWVEPAFISSFARFFRRVPLVLTVHSLKPKKSALHAQTLAAVDRVLFNSAYTMSQAAGMGYRSRGQVIYQGYDDSLFGTLPPSGRWRTKLEIPASAPVIAAVGRMIEVKGLHILAAAADDILARRPDAHLVFAGDGPIRPQVERMIAGSPRQSRVHFAGALGREEVARLLADADLFVNPGVIDSRGRAEGLGITTIEAMASGLAVVGSRVGGIVETVMDGVTGVLVGPGDRKALAAAVGRLLDDAKTRRAMGEAGRALAKKRFTWPVLAGQVARVYREELGSPIPSVPQGS